MKLALANTHTHTHPPTHTHTHTHTHTQTHANTHNDHTKLHENAGMGGKEWKYSVLERSKGKKCGASSSNGKIGVLYCHSVISVPHSS